MGTPRKIVLPPNFTGVPNVLYDEFADMTLAELKVTLEINRRTFAFGVAYRLISITELQEATKLSRQAAQNGVQLALERGYVGRRREGHGFAYGIVVGEPTAKKAGSRAPAKESRNENASVLQKRTPSNKEINNPSGETVTAGHSTAKKPRSGDPFKPEHNLVDAAIVGAFERWHSGTGRTPASKLTNRRAGQIRARLKEAADASGEESLELRVTAALAELTTAIDGMVHSEWHKANGHQEFDQMFRNRDCVDKFLARRAEQLSSSNGNGASKMSAEERKRYDTTKPNPELTGAQHAPA